MTSTGLILGGGGITGIAWEVGLLKGLRDAGCDLTDAERTVGTSAGSVVGALITSGRDLDEIYVDQLGEPDLELGGEFERSMLVRLLATQVLPGSHMRKRQRLGAAALKAHPEPGDERTEIIRDRLGDIEDWPDRELLITAVAAESGEFRAFRAGQGVSLVEALAASCAVPLVWPTVHISGVAYIDGGMRSAANADLAAGCERVVVLAPLEPPLAGLNSIERQLARVNPQRCVVVRPDPAALRDFGRNLLDPRHRAPAARAGLRQAAVEVERVRRVWDTESV